MPRFFCSRGITWGTLRRQLCCTQNHTIFIPSEATCLKFHGKYSWGLVLIWMFPKIVGFPPKSSILIGFSGFPLFSPSILGYHYFCKPHFVPISGVKTLPGYHPCMVYIYLHEWLIFMVYIMVYLPFFPIMIVEYLQPPGNRTSSSSGDDETSLALAGRTAYRACYVHRFFSEESSKSSGNLLTMNKPTKNRDCSRVLLNSEKNWS